MTSMFACPLRPRAEWALGEMHLPGAMGYGRSPIPRATDLRGDPERPGRVLAVRRPTAGRAAARAPCGGVAASLRTERGWFNGHRLSQGRGQRPPPSAPGTSRGCCCGFSSRPPWASGPGVSFLSSGPRPGPGTGCLVAHRDFFNCGQSQRRRGQLCVWSPEPRVRGRACESSGGDSKRVIRLFKP